MRGVVNISMLLALFALGYTGARIFSAPAPASKANGADLIQGPSAVIAPSVPRVLGPGSAVLIAAMGEVEAALRRGDFESLIGGEWESQALHAWAKADPAGLWEFMEAGGWVAQSDIIGLDRTLFRNWFRLDPDAAVAAIEKTHRYAQHNGRWAMFGLLFDEDPEVVRAVGERLDQFAATCRPQPGEHGSRHWRGGLEVVERMMGLPDSNSKEMLIEVAVGGWAESDWRAAREWAASLPQPQRAAMERAIFNGADAWNQIREPEGIEWVKEWLARDENRDMRAKLGGDLVEALARTDPGAALDWAGENLGGKPLGDAVGAIVTRQFAKDRDGAIALVDALPPGGVRARAGSDLISAMARKEPRAAFDRAIGELGGGHEIDRGAWARVGDHLSRAEPDRVLEILAAAPDEVPWIFDERMYDASDDKDLERTLRVTSEWGNRRGERVYRWAWYALNRRDPAAAAQWPMEGAR